MENLDNDPLEEYYNQFRSDFKQSERHNEIEYIKTQMLLIKITSIAIGIIIIVLILSKI
jgi:hypothetical protein